jgi:hypothetical protein
MERNSDFEDILSIGSISQMLVEKDSALKTDTQNY